MKKLAGRLTSSGWIGSTRVAEPRRCVAARAPVKCITVRTCHHPACAAGFWECGRPTNGASPRQKAHSASQKARAQQTVKRSLASLHCHARHARHTCHTRHAALVALTAIAAVAAANTSREHHPATLAAPAHHTRNTPMQSASPLPCLSPLVLTSRNPDPRRNRSLPHRSLPHMRSASPLRSSSGALAAFATLVTLVALAALKAQPNRPPSTRCRLRAGPHVGHRPR